MTSDSGAGHEPSGRVFLTCDQKTEVEPAATGHDHTLHEFLLDFVQHANNIVLRIGDIAHFGTERGWITILTRYAERPTLEKHLQIVYSFGMTLQCSAPFRLDKRMIYLWRLLVQIRQPFNPPSYFIIDFA